MLLQLVQCFPLLFNHVSVGEWEIIDSLDRLHPLLIRVPFALLIFQDLIGLDKGIDLVCFILLLVDPLLMHLFPLELEKALLILPIANLIHELSVSLLMNLVDNLPEQIIVIGSIKNDFLVKSIAHFTIEEA